MPEQNIKTFAVLDLETNGLPKEQSNTCSITELSIYAFSEKYLLDENDDEINLAVINKEGIEGVEQFKMQFPDLPRVLHKLTMMINPDRSICSIVEKMSGLNNNMLSNEAPFDKTTADCLLLFLERLEKPICLVAHNGWSFDFPIIRHVLEKINMTLPSSIFCVDSMKAFREFDEKQIHIEKATKVLPTIGHMDKEGNKICLNNKTNAQLEGSTENVIPIIISDSDEEDIPNGSTTLQKSGPLKRIHDTINVEPSTSPRPSSSCLLSMAEKRLASLREKRALFSDKFSPKTKYPKKGVYILGNIYERIFKIPAENLHRAESDVAILTKLILHYGLYFLAYAEERKMPFNKVTKL